MLHCGKNWRKLMWILEGICISCMSSIFVKLLNFRSVHKLNYKFWMYKCIAINYLMEHVFIHSIFLFYVSQTRLFIFFCNNTPTSTLWFLFHIVTTVTMLYYIVWNVMITLQFSVPSLHHWWLFCVSSRKLSNLIRYFSTCS